MRRHNHIISCIVLVCISSWPVVTFADVLKLGILAYRPESVVEARWQPLAKYLEQALDGNPVRLEALSYADLNDALEHHRLDFVLTNPAHYIELRQRYQMSGALATLAESLGGAPLDKYGGVIVAASERTDIQRLKDLKDKRIAYVNSESLGGFQAQALEMIRAGIPPPYTSHSLITGMPHDKALAAVVSGKADAAFVRTGIIEELAKQGKLDISQLKIVSPHVENGFPFALSTPLYPEWPFVVMPQVDRQLARRVAAALFAIESGSEVARKTSIYGFSIPAEYSAVEVLMRELRVPPFAAPPQFTIMDIWDRHRFSLLTAAIALAAVLFMTALLLARNRQLILSRQKTERISKSLAESERQLNQAQAIAHIGSWNLDIVADKLTWSEEIYRMFGLPIDAPQKLETFLALIHPDDREYVGKAWSDTVKNNAIYDIEHRILINDQVRWVRERAEISRDYKGVALSSLGTIQDITEKKRTEAMIWHEANFDRLTDLPNRALLFNRISTSLAAAYRHNKIVALFCADLDGFKAVNDVHGHKAGDHVLAAVAKRWRVRVRETDTVARIGGDEFAILLPDIGQLEVAEHIANKMIAALQEPIVLPDGESVQIGASIGVSLFPNNAGEIDSMMAAADEAMYRSKARGKNCYVLSERRHDMLGSQGEWIKMNDDHLLGIEVIDEQHRKLVDITNNINRAIQRNADRDELDLLMGELVSFARIHFDTEEDLMQGQGYPEIEEHKREHGWLLNKLQFLSSGGGEGHEMEILQTLKDWLFRHIDIEDKKFAAMGKATHHSAIQQSRQCDSTQSL